MPSADVKKQKKRSLPTKATCFTAAIDGFQGGPEAIRSVVDVAGRLNVVSPDTLRDMARAFLDRALKSKKDGLKGFAVLARRLSDRLPRTGTYERGDLLSFAAALYALCESEFESLCSLQPPQGPLFCRGSNDENQENDAHRQRAAVENSMQNGFKEEQKTDVDVCEQAAAGEPSGHTQGTMQRFDSLQLFSACLYTQDVVPEDFVHKLLDFHRFSGGSCWPAELRFAGLGSVVEMMSYCGKRLEKLGSLKHVMPDFYTFLADVARDRDCPQDLRNRICDTLRLRENDWVEETFEDPDPLIQKFEDPESLILHDPPVLGS